MLQPCSPALCSPPHAGKAQGPVVTLRLSSDPLRCSIALYPGAGPHWPAADSCSNFIQLQGAVVSWFSLHQAQTWSMQREFLLLLSSPCPNLGPAPSLPISTHHPRTERSWFPTPCLWVLTFHQQNWTFSPYPESTTSLPRTKNGFRQQGPQSLSCPSLLCHTLSSPPPTRPHSALTAPTLSPSPLGRRGDAILIFLLFLFVWVGG